MPEVGRRLGGEVGQADEGGGEQDWQQQQQGWQQEAKETEESAADHFVSTSATALNQLIAGASSSEQSLKEISNVATGATQT